MNERVAPPEIIATIRSQEDLIEALRSAKEMRNLSFKTLDALGDFTEGHMERVIGPRREKGMSPFVMQMLCSLLAVKLEMVFDPDQAAKMKERWEGRNTSNVRIEKGRVSQTLIERAKPLVFKQTGQIGGLVTAHMRTPAHRSEAARNAARARWKGTGLKKTKKAKQRRMRYRNNINKPRSHDGKSQQDINEEGHL